MAKLKIHIPYIAYMVGDNDILSLKITLRLHINAVIKYFFTNNINGVAYVKSLFCERFVIKKRFIN